MLNYFIYTRIILISTKNYGKFYYLSQQNSKKIISMHLSFLKKKSKELVVTLLPCFNKNDYHIFQKICTKQIPLKINFWYVY